jgi:hypothetical protein
MGWFSDKKSMPEQRYQVDRRWCNERRIDTRYVEKERRSGLERRARSDRRS